MNETLNLANFVAELDYDKLPEKVQIMGLRLLFDFVGNSIYATKTEAAKAVTKYCRRQSPEGKAFIFPDFKKGYEASFAALANGILGHGFELDDVYMATCLHPSGPVVAAALAVAQERGASGKKLLEGIIAGYEVAIRAGLPLGSSHQDWGYHATASFTVFGAAAAAAKILGLTGEQTAWSFGLAGSLASGTKQFSKSVSPSMCETLHGGKAAQQGVMCAMLAENGFTGPIDVLEGPVFGFLKVYRGTRKPEDIDYSKIDAGLGEKYHCIDISIKPNCNCATTLTACQVLEDFKKDPDFKPENIEKVIMHAHHNILQAHMDYQPKSVAAAQYSTPFSIALNILRDVKDPSPFLNDDLCRDPEVLEMAQKVTAELDPEIDALFPEHFANRVEIVMKDGKIFEGKYIDYRGSAENPFTYEEIIGKFRGLANYVYPSETVEKLESNLRNTASFENVNEMFETL